ncbi:MAG TPA: DNA polymerase, partial [Ilumatobacteraceae bacterium]|nr:DNA polymerase [Ilumatobacteraceae bacterium]
AADDSATLIAAGVRLARAWELDAVHRILHGGWRADPVRIWCTARGLDRRTAPTAGQLDLGAVDAGGRGDEPIRPDGYLQPDWVEGAWRSSHQQAQHWARLARELATQQEREIAGLQVRGDAAALARAESTAALLAAELAHDGLPVHIPTAEAIIAQSVGPRPRTDAEAQAGRDERDAEVIRHVPGIRTDLRNPADVRAMLRRVGIDVPDTRAWRLEAMREQHPVVDALLQWRKAERMATTFGYGWLDQHVRDGRLRGEWSGSDGAAGRMTASNGLHNLPAELRPAVRAEPGHVFVRADLGQIEPRVLAAVSGDQALIRAAQEDDLYAPVAARLKVERPRAKVAVLAAMYGQTSGTAGEALRGMEAGYPVAMKFLADAARSGMEGRDLRTYGGRLVRMWDIEDAAGEQRSAAAARGRYARNAMVQGAAAEVFKVWAVTVRARGSELGAQIVLCLHDELLVHVPQEHGDACAQLLHDCLAEAAHRWQRGAGVRFVADVSVVPDWASAKG